MSQSPTLGGWFLRDLSITAVILGLLIAGHGLYSAFPHWWVAAPVSILGFVGCYALCYIVHEWGHYVGARMSGITMPLAPYKSVVLGVFHLQDYTRRQYLWLSWGGDLGHVLVSVIAMAAWFHLGGLVLSAFALGGLLFTAQALLVDQPVIWRVTGGADIEATAAAGTSKQMILKRTWQSWSVVLILLGVWQLTA